MEPTALPLTIPVEVTVAIDGVLLTHVPPDGVPAHVVVPPTHTVLLPEIVVAVAVTVTVLIA